MTTSSGLYDTYLGGVSDNDRLAGVVDSFRVCVVIGSAIVTAWESTGCILGRVVQIIIAIFCPGILGGEIIPEPND